MPWPAWILWAGVAQAHPFTAELVGHRLDVDVTAAQVELIYEVEIPTRALLGELREHLAGTPTPTDVDQQAFTASKLEELLGGLRVVADGAESALELPLEMQPPLDGSGVGDTRFIKYRLAARAALPAGTATLNVINNNYPGDRAAFVSTLDVGPAIDLSACTLVETADGHVRADHAGRWRMDEESRELRMAFRTRGALNAAVQRRLRALSGGEPLAPAATALDPDASLSALLEGERAASVMTAGLLLAALLGAAHAVAPGHGQALIAAYLLGARQTVSVALGGGGVVAVSHTLGVYLLAGLAWAARGLLPESVLVPWMELISGAAVLALGLWLIRARHHPHDHTHAPTSGRRTLLAMGIAGGLIPCPGALVLLLVALHVDRLAYGLALVAAFSAGLAILISALGVLLVRLGARAGERRGWGAVLSGVGIALVMLLGVALTWRGASNLFAG